MFSYPLTLEELCSNSAVKLNRHEIGAELEDLLRRGLLKQHQGYFMSPQASLSSVERREKGNEGAARILPQAYDYSLRIARFPFVEGICLSGGLSKNYYDSEGDIDYLIMTRPDRLWICRTLLIIRYKLLPASKKKFWCINYFIGAEDLLIPDINYFVSTELSHLIPTVNYSFYERILEANAWYRAHYPNKPLASAMDSAGLPSSFWKRLVERLCAGAFGAWLDDLLLGYTLRRWRRKYPQMSEEDFELQFRSRKNVCKRHTHGFQNKVLQAWTEKINAFEAGHQVKLRT